MTVELETKEQEVESNPNEGMVEVHEASIDDLDAALKNAEAQEKSAPPVSDETLADPSLESNEVPKPVGESETQESGVATQGADPSKPGVNKVYTQEEVQAIIAENERVKKQGDQKELFIQHRSNELGALKKDFAEKKAQLANLKAQLMNGLEDRFSENPTQALADRDAIKDIDKRLLEIEGTERRAEHIAEAQTVFLRHVGTDSVTVDDLGEVLKADGVDDQFVAQFKANPWEFTTPEALVQMGKRAMDRKELVKASEDRAILARYVMSLKSEIAALKGRPAQVMNQVQKHLNSSPSVTAASGASTKASNSISLSAVPNLSEAELNSALQNAMRH